MTKKHKTHHNPTARTENLEPLNHQEFYELLNLTPKQVLLISMSQPRLRTLPVQRNTK